MTDSTAALTPQEARELIARTERLGADAHRAMRLPYIAFLLAYGVATSLGTFAMALTSGRAFSAALVGMVVVAIALVTGFSIAVRDHIAFSYSRRWCGYIAAWFVPYAVAIAIVIWMPGNIALSAIASGVILLSTAACACWEARS